MPNNTTKQQAIDHYTKMIEWVKMQDLDDNLEVDGLLISSHKMHSAIGINMGWQCCDYCEIYKCNVCKLAESNGSKCCGNMYEKMCSSKTWRSWLYWAYRVRAYIRRNG